MAKKLISYNVNGIRAAKRKGFDEWLESTQADIVVIQETKAQEHQLDDPVFSPPGYNRYFHDAQKKGYSGVAIYSKHAPKNISRSLIYPLADEEGRFVQFDYDNLSVVSLYLPSGTSGDARQALKYEFLDFFIEKLIQIRDEGREYIICGDWNIAHKNIDLKNWRSNQKNSGFLPKERAWLDRVFDEVGFVDAFRVVNQEPDQYTWWSNRGQAYAKNVGWRLDYHVVSPGLRDVIQSASIYKQEKFDKVVLVSGDGDYRMLVDFLIEENKLEKVLFPKRRFASSLYKPIGATYYADLSNEATIKKIGRQ
jgi:exodeoxyribonuclease-3